MSQRFAPLFPRPGICIMRDGVICQRSAGPLKLDEPIELVPGALEGLRLLARLDVPVIVLSCHSAPGEASSAPAGEPPVSVRDAHQRLRSTLRSNGARVDGIRSYPVATRDGAQRERKALVRLLQRAARLYALDLASSVLIGDSWSDMHAAVDAGCQPVLVMTGRGREQIALPQFAATRARAWYAADLAGAALTIDTYFNGLRSTQTVA